jgi:hypothetical protein
MSWMDAFRLAGGNMHDYQVEEVRAFMAVHGYTTTTDMWWIDRVVNTSTGAHVYSLGDASGTQSIREHIYRSLPQDLIQRLDYRFGRVDPNTFFQIIIDEASTLCKPLNVGAATKLPLPK